MPRDARHSPAPSKLRALSRYGFGNRPCITGFILIACSASSVRRPVLVLLSRCGDCQYMDGGKGPGWVAVGLSTLAVLYFFIPPVRTWTLKPTRCPVFSHLRCLSSGRQIWLISWRRQTEESLRRARDELEVRVGERTAELKNANETLLKQIAEQKRTEEALQITRTELARVARITTIGELTASIAHEVNQPLAAVVANADACVAWLSIKIQILAKRGRRRSAPFTARHARPRSSSEFVRLLTRRLRRDQRVHINEIIEDTVALAEPSRDEE